MTTEQSKFEGWALVEIFGHQRYSGYVTTEQFGQAAMFRVDVPPLPERERVTKSYEYAEDGTSIPPGSTVKEAALSGYSKLFGVGAIYALTPCDEAAAMKAVEATRPRKLQLVKLADARAIGPVERATNDGSIGAGAFVSDEGDETEDDFPQPGDDGEDGVMY